MCIIGFRFLHFCFTFPIFEGEIETEERITTKYELF